MKKNVLIGNRSEKRLDDLQKNGLIDSQQRDNFNQKYDAFFLTESIIGLNTIDSMWHKIGDTASFLLFGAVRQDEPLDLYEVRNHERYTEIKLKNKVITLIGNYGARSNDFVQSVNFINQHGGELRKIITEILNPILGLKRIQQLVDGCYFFGKHVIEMQKD